jgi:hypothetical protein
MSEIKLCTAQRIGQLSRELEKDKGGRPEKTLPRGGKSFCKSEQLKSAGISTSSAHRFEEPSSPMEKLVSVFAAAHENPQDLPSKNVDPNWLETLEKEDDGGK